MVQFDMLGMVSYWCSIVTLSLKHTILRDIQLQKMSTFLKVIESGTVP